MESFVSREFSQNGCLAQWLIAHCGDTYYLHRVGGAGHVPWCFPYFESCSSISATGRHGAAFFLFKATMIPSAMLQMLYWYLASQWLQKLGDKVTPARFIFFLGMLAAIFLVVYCVALGASGDFLRVQRRIAVICYFTFTYLSQLLLVWRMGRLRVEGPSRNWLLGLCITTLTIGVATIVFDLVSDNYDDYEDAFEWTLALLIHLYFLVTVVTWRRTGFEVNYAIR